MPFFSLQTGVRKERNTVPRDHSLYENSHKELKTKINTGIKIIKEKKNSEQ